MSNWRHNISLPVSRFSNGNNWATLPFMPLIVAQVNSWENVDISLFRKRKKKKREKQKKELEMDDAVIWHRQLRSAPSLHFLPFFLNHNFMAALTGRWLNDDPSHPRHKNMESNSDRRQTAWQDRSQPWPWPHRWTPLTRNDGQGLGNSQQFTWNEAGFWQSSPSSN